MNTKLIATTTAVLALGAAATATGIAVARGGDDNEAAAERIRSIGQGRRTRDVVK